MAKNDESLQTNRKSNDDATEMKRVGKYWFDISIIGVKTRKKLKLLGKLVD